MKLTTEEIEIQTNFYKRNREQNQIIPILSKCQTLNSIKYLRKKLDRLFKPFQSINKGKLPSSYKGTDIALIYKTLQKRIKLENNFNSIY